MELTVINLKQAQYSNSYCMLKGLQNNYDALKAYELSKKIQEVWLRMINTSAHWDLELLFARGKA